MKKCGLKEITEKIIKCNYKGLKKESIVLLNDTCNDGIINYKRRFSVLLKEYVFGLINSAISIDDHSATQREMILTLNSADPGLYKPQEWLDLNYLLQRFCLFRCSNIVRNKARESAYIGAGNDLSFQNLLFSFKAAIDDGDYAKADYYKFIIQQIGVQPELYKEIEQCYSLFTNFSQNVVNNFINNEDDIFFQEIKGKNIAIVGPSITKNIKNNDIDAFDIVVRIGYKGKKFLPQHKYCGSKTDISYYGDYNYRMYVEEKNAFFLKDISWAIFKSIIQHEKINVDINVKIRTFNKFKYYFTGSPRMAENAIYDLLNFSPLKIKVFNVNFYCSSTKHHENYAPTSRERADYRMKYGVPNYKLWQGHTNWAHHDLLSNINFVRNLWLNGNIEVDTECAKILKMTNDEYLCEMERLHVHPYLTGENNADTLINRTSNSMQVPSLKIGNKYQEAVIGNNEKSPKCFNSQIENTRCMKSATHKAKNLYVSSHHQVFFGYYDITPFSFDETKLLAMHAPLENSTPTPNSQLKIGYYDLKQENSQFQFVDTTSTWCWQMGCRLQWYPAAGENSILYNRLVNGKYGSVIQDVYSKKILKTYSYPMYAVSPDGRWGLSLNFSRLQRLRPGYGYTSLPDVTQNDLAPIRDGIWRIDMQTGRAKFLLSLRRVKDIKPHKSMEGAEHYFNHLLFNPSSTRFLFMHLWVKDGKRFSRLLTADHNGANVCVLNNEGYSSHYTWKSDSEILVYSQHSPWGRKFYLYKDKTENKSIFGDGVLTEDGHPSFFPRNNNLITDTYPNKKREQSLLFYNHESKKIKCIYKSIIPSSFTKEVRCDFHPRLSPSGKYLCIDDVENNKRVMRILDIENIQGNNDQKNNKTDETYSINQTNKTDKQIIDRKFRLARIWSNKELKKIAHLFTGKVVNVSAGDDVDKQGDTYRNYFFNAQSYHTTNHAPGKYRGFQGRPGEILLDLKDMIPDELSGAFDVVFNHTTLEHIFEVQTAFSNLCQFTTDILIVVVPFCQVQHETPGYEDFWRFTPTCVRQMFKNNDLEVIYEVANNDPNAATYLLFVGSRHPEKWNQKIPSFKPIEKAGAWIGEKNPTTQLPAIHNNTSNTSSIKEANSEKMLTIDEISKITTVIVRSVGERTTAACIFLLQQALPDSEIICINEIPFSKAVKRTFEIGIEKNRKWTLVIDADVLIRSGFISEIVSFAETQPDNTFVVQGLIFDKFLHVLRPAGNHLYNTKHLSKAVKLIPEEGSTLRPERTTVYAMTDKGFRFHQKDFIVGLHDFEQDYFDIVKKSFVHAHKHKNALKKIIALWQDKSKTDEDYELAIIGAMIGNEFGGPVFINDTFLNNKISKTLTDKNIPRKRKLPYNQYNDYTVNNNLQLLLNNSQLPILQQMIYHPDRWNTIK